MQVSDVYEQLAKLPVDSYGARSALSEIAELTIHDTMVYVKPYDPTQVGYLEKKIAQSLGQVGEGDRCQRADEVQRGEL